MEDEEDYDDECEYDDYGNDYSYYSQYDSYDSYDDYDCECEEDEDEEDLSHRQDLCEHCKFVTDCRKYNLEKGGKIVRKSRRRDYIYGRII